MEPCFYLPQRWSWGLKKFAHSIPSPPAPPQWKIETSTNLVVDNLLLIVLAVFSFQKKFLKIPIFVKFEDAIRVRMYYNKKRISKLKSWTLKKLLISTKKIIRTKIVENWIFYKRVISGAISITSKGEELGGSKGLKQIFGVPQLLPYWR